MASTSAADCALALFSGWVARFGVPAAITSDRGPQFTSALWAALCQLLRIEHIPTTAFHPQGNGLVERLHRRLKDALRARSAGPNWFLHLPWVLLAVRSTPHDASASSPAEDLYGAQLVVPGEFLDSPEPPPVEFLSRLRAVVDRVALPTWHNVSKSVPLPAAPPPSLLACRRVFVRRDGNRPPLTAAYDGPYLVLRRSVHHFELQVGSRTDTVSVHRLKPAYLPDDATAAQPPKRGRPRLPPAVPPPRVVRRVHFLSAVEVIPVSDGPSVVSRRPVRLRRPPARLLL